MKRKKLNLAKLSLGKATISTLMQGNVTGGGTNSVYPFCSVGFCDTIRDCPQETGMQEGCGPATNGCPQTAVSCRSIQVCPGG